MFSVEADKNSIPCDFAYCSLRTPDRWPGSTLSKKAPSWNVMSRNSAFKPCGFGLDSTLRRFH
jgi:hypothetical protein